MTVDLNTVSIPLEYLPFCCVGFIVVLAIVWGGVKIAQSLAPKKETVYYGRYPYSNND